MIHQTSHTTKSATTLSNTGFALLRWMRGLAVCLIALTSTAAFAGLPTAPVLSPVAISSNNANPIYAAMGDTVTVSFTADGVIDTPTVTLLGEAASVTNTSGNDWTATVAVGAGTVEGAATFTITASLLSGSQPATVSATTDSSSVTVDKTAPTLNLPANITIEAADANGATVTYSASATDGGSGVATSSFLPASGSVFPIGTTTVNASATDNAGNMSTGSFTVTVTVYTLQVLHYYGESGLLGIETAPILGAMIDRMDNDYANTVVLGEGDSFIPGPWLIGGADPSFNRLLHTGTFTSAADTSATPFAQADVAIMNAFGTTASALGNHEFDLGSPVLAGAMFPATTASVGDWAGAQFPLITANLDFANDSSLRGRADTTIGGTGGAIAGSEVTAIKAKIAPYAVKTLNGQKIGFVGATTWELLSKSSPNGTVPKDDANAGTSDLQEVAAYLQGAVNALQTLGVNKIILIDQLDTLQRNKDLAPLVSGIDIMVAGGGHERMGDATDTAVGFNGHSADFITDVYPIVTAGLDGAPMLIVTTDTEYTYLGRLVVDFDASGRLIVLNLSPATNGAYAANEATLQNVYGTADTAAQIIATSTIGMQVKAITDAINAIIIAKDGNVYGYTNVYLEGDRVFGRTQEVNLGDITADANILKAKAALGFGSTSAVFSLKNGGGLRASLGSVLADGSKVAPLANAITGKPAGGISQLDVENALRFDNKLMVCDMTPTGLLNILNFAAGLSSGPTAQAGGYAQVGNIRFSYDSARPAGQKVRNAVLVNDNGDIVATVVANGAVSPSAPVSIKVVALNFTMNGGDNYPIKYTNPPTNTTVNNEASNFRYILTNGTLSALVARNLDFTATTTFTSLALTAADILGEQKAFQDYLAAKHPIAGTAYNTADTPVAQDTRIQQLAQNGNSDTVNTGATYISTVTIGSASVTEGNGSTTTVNLPVTHVSNTSATFTVNYAVTGGTATAGTDYATLAAGTLTFGAGGGTQNITITVNGDTAVESNETITVALSNLVNTSGTTTIISTATGTATINNDDTIPLVYPASSAYTSTLKGSIPLAGAEIPAFDPLSKRAFASSNVGIQVVDLTDPSAPTLITTITPATLGVSGLTSNDVSSVTVRKGDGSNPSVLAAAIISSPKSNLGYVVFLNAADGTLLGSIQVGSNPDQITFTPDGTKLLVANEAELDGAGTGNADVFADTTLGTVSIINVSNFASLTVATADFTAYDTPIAIAALRAAGVRIFKNSGGTDALPSRDFEPEYIAVSPDGTTAMVTLQEANAVATLDIASATFTSVVPLGKKDFSPLRVDFSDRDGPSASQLINPTTGNPVFGLYMPDAIAAYSAGGQTYYVTANEGDDRNDFLNPDETTTVGAAGYVLDTTVFPNAAALKNNASLGRLTVSNAPGLRGDTDGDGDIDQILSYGGRSFSILDSAGNRVFDSGDMIDLIVTSQHLGNLDDGRSDNKGSEPEGVTIAVLGGRTYAFIGLERSHMALMFDVTNPLAPTFTTAFKRTGDLNPEGLVVVSASDSPNGKPLLITASEVSNTLTVFEINDTLAPALALPSNIITEATGPVGATVTYTASATDGGSGVATSSFLPASGSVFAIGETTVNASATDNAGNSSSGSFTVTVQDTTDPSITGTFSPTIIVAGTVLADYTSQAVANDIVGVTSITQSPAPGTTTTAGTLSVTLTAHDAAGNTADVSFNVTVIPTGPIKTQIASKGAPVPGAGVSGTGIPAGAIWSSFGVPSINDAGNALVLATYKASSVSTTAILGWNITNMAGTIKVIAKKGDAAPGITNAVIKGFKEPLLGSDGSVAWIAVLANAPTTSGAVTATDDSAICLDADGTGAGTAVVVAREGAATWKTFTSVALGEHAVAFTASLNGAAPTTDTGLWVYDRGAATTALAIREGDSLLGSTVKVIAALVTRAGSPGQGHGVEYDGAADSIPVRVTLNDSRHALGSVGEDGISSFDHVSAGNAVGYGSGAKWQSFGVPTQNAASSAMAFLGTVQAGTGNATKANKVAIFAEDDSTYTAERIVSLGDAAGVSSGVFSAMKDPVNAANRGVAFIGAMKLDASNGITASNNDGIWRSDDTNGLSLVAREGFPSSDVAGAQWKAFTSLALPEGARGPVFVATMTIGTGGITTANDTGLWATDRLGALRLLLQEGDMIGAVPVKSFTVLSSVTGSPAQTRSFSSGGDVIVRATDTTGAQHLIHIVVP